MSENIASATFLSPLITPTPTFLNKPCKSKFHSPFKVLKSQ
jgi:hypothetical protein